MLHIHRQKRGNWKTEREREWEKETTESKESVEKSERKQNKREWDRKRVIKRECVCVRERWIGLGDTLSLSRQTSSTVWVMEMKSDSTALSLSFRFFLSVTPTLVCSLTLPHTHSLAHPPLVSPCVIQFSTALFLPFRSLDHFSLCLLICLSCTAPLIPPRFSLHLSCSIII